MNFTSVKLSNNALNFLLAQYRAIFKRAYVKGLASAVLLTAGLAAGQAQAALTNVSTLPQDGQTAIINGDAGATGTYDPETNEAEFDRIAITSGEGALSGTLTITSGAAATGGSDNFITASTGDINISGTGTLSININAEGDAATEGLLIGGNVNDVTIDIGTIDVQTGLLKVTDGAGGSSGDVVLSADIINIGSENGAEAYLTASSDGATKSVTIGRAGETGKEDSVINVYGGGTLTLATTAGTGVTVKGKSLTVASDGILLTNNGTANKISTANFTVEDGAFHVITSSTNGGTETFDGHTANINGNVLVGSGASWTLAATDDTDTENVIEGTTTFGATSNVQLGGTLTVSGGTLTVASGAGLYATQAATGSDKAGTIVVTKDSSDAAGTLQISSTDLKQFLTGKNANNEALTYNKITTDTDGKYVLSGSGEAVQGSILLSDTGILELTDSARIDLATDLTFSDGGTNGRAGTIVVNKGTVKGQNLAVSKAIANVTTTDKLSVEADALTLGIGSGTGAENKLSAFNISGAVVHKSLTLEANDGQGTFTVDSDLTFSGDYYAKDANGDDITSSPNPVGQIKGDNIVLSGTGALAPMAITGGAWENEGQSLTIQSGSLAITAGAGSQADESGNDTNGQWDYYKNGNPASLTWSGDFVFSGATAATDAAVTVSGASGADATLDLRDAKITWGSGSITLSGAIAAGEDDPVQVSPDDYFKRAGLGILRLDGDQVAEYFDMLNSDGKATETTLKVATGGLLLVDGSINGDVDVAKFNADNATKGLITLSGGNMFVTGSLSLVDGVDTNGQADAAAQGLKIDGVLGADSITLTNKSTAITEAMQGTDQDVATVSGGTLAVASRLSSDNHTIAFNSGAGLILDTNGFLAQYDATIVGDSGTVDVERLVFNGDKSKLDVQTGAWTIGSLTNLGDIDLQGGAKLNVGPGYEEYVRTGVGASLTADNLGVSDASTEITIAADGSAKFNTVQAAGATFEVGDGATLEITGIVNTGDFDTDGSVKDNAPDTLADIGDADDVKAQAGINLDGTTITVNGGTFILGDTAARTLIALDASSGAADAVTIKTGLEGAVFNLTDGASLRLDFTKTEADGENPINGIAGVNGGVALTAAQAKELKEELINGGRLDQGSYINVGDLALGMEYDSATMTADWDKIKDFVQIESDVTNDAYIQLLIKNAQDGLTGQFGAVETSKNTTTVEGSLGLHKAYADNGTGEKFFASQVVNGTRQAAGLTVTNNSTLSLYGEGTVGTLQGAGTDSDSVVLFKAGDLQQGETVVKPINKNSLAISDMGRIVAENNVRVEGSAEAGSIEVDQNFSATNLELDGAAGDSSTVYGTLDIAETLTLSTKSNRSNSLLIANGQVKATTTVLADNSTLQVGRDALAAQDDPDTTEIDEGASYSGIFETTNFAMNGGLLIVDPEYGDATALASIRNFVGVSDAEYTDQSKVGTADGSIFVGQNSALGIGTESAADLAQVIAQYQTNGSLSGAADKLGAIVYLDGIATVDAGHGIVMTNKSLAGFVDYYNGANGNLADITESAPTIADTIFFGDGTAMLATAEAITAAQAQNTALVTFDSSNGKLVADGGEILITGDLRGNTGYKLFADKGTGTNGDWITVVDVAGQNVTSGNGITVTTENGFLVGEINNENGGTVTLGLADDARARMSGASDPVYTTLVAYFNGYNSKYDDGQGNISYDYIGTPTADADGDGINDSNYQYSNAFLAEAIAQGNGAAAETAARFGVYGGAPQAAIQAGKSSTDAIAQRFGIGSAVSNLTLAGNTQGAALWLAPVYKSADSDGFEAQGLDYGVNVDLYGVALGADYTLANGITFGAMFNVGSGEVDGESAASATSNDFDYYGFGLYAGYTMGQFSVVGDISYTTVDNDLEGSTSIDRIGASMDSTNLSIGVTGKYELSFNGVDITPHAGVRFSNIDLDDYTIDGNDVIAAADSDDMSIFSIPVGVTFAKEFKGETWTMAPSFDLTLTGQFGDDELDGDVSWAGVSNLSTHTTTEVFDNFTYGATLGVEAQSVGGVALGLSVGYTGSSNTDELGVNANARFVF